ncbi:hypothetical protein DNK77_12385 [Enterobacter cloacae complex sp.]|nr:hypothetical protein DNK77_12385 [Enterobacter cloacae complex sp.]
MGSCAAPSAKGDDKFITTDYLQQCRCNDLHLKTPTLQVGAFSNAGRYRYGLKAMACGLTACSHVLTQS